MISGVLRLLYITQAIVYVTMQEAMAEQRKKDELLIQLCSEWGRPMPQ